jgi:hypothetical protein
MQMIAASPAYQQLHKNILSIDPSARLVPLRGLRRLIRRARDWDEFGASAPHELCWRMSIREIEALFPPSELGLHEADTTSELVLIPVPTDSVNAPQIERLRIALYHAGVDRLVDAAFASGRLDREWVSHFTKRLGRSQWDEIRTVLMEAGLIAEGDSDRLIAREFIAYFTQLWHLDREHLSDFFPGLRHPDQLAEEFAFLPTAALAERTRPLETLAISVPESTVDQAVIVPPSPSEPLREEKRAQEASEKGNNVKAAILLHQIGSEAALDELHRLASRLHRLGTAGIEESDWLEALKPLLAPASSGWWPVERRILYEFQRVCLVTEKPHYAVDLVEWAATFGKQPVKRLLTKATWPMVGRHLRAILNRSKRLLEVSPQLLELVEKTYHHAEHQTRESLRPTLKEALEQVGLAPNNIAEQVSRDKAVEELLDKAWEHSYIRIGDLRDALARSRVKLPDLSGPGELLQGDSLIRANRLLAVKLDGVYRRGEIYMRMLQRACSLFFGTWFGRFFVLYFALPLVGAFVLVEGAAHMFEAAEGLIHWVADANKPPETPPPVAFAPPELELETPLLEDEWDPEEVPPPPITLSAKPPKKTTINWPILGTVTVVLFLLIHWPDFRNRLLGIAKFALFKIPLAIRHSEWLRAIFINPITKFLRRYILLPAVIGGVVMLFARWLGVTWYISGIYGACFGIIMGVMFRTSLGRGLEDSVNDAVEHVWKIISVNFFLGLLGWFVQVSRSILEGIDAIIYAVDEWLRFREGQSRFVFFLKLFFGTGWFLFTYLFRFAWNLLIEPQINPIKHFPVVTVSHKLLLPLIPSLAKQFGTSNKTMGTIVFGIPGIFGFLVWELKENWKLYRANAPKTLKPVMIGSHGEKTRALLRPGFHSGVIPKLYQKIRKALRENKTSRLSKLHHKLAHTAEALHHFVERDFIATLNHSRRWGGQVIQAGEIQMGTNRIRLPLHLEGHRREVIISIEERKGWLIGSVENPGWLNCLSHDQRQAFEDALVGLYQFSGVDLLREQAAHKFGPNAFNLDAVKEGVLIPDASGKYVLHDYVDGPELRFQTNPLDNGSMVLSTQSLTWDHWIERWQLDDAGKSPTESLIPGWTFLPHTLPDISAKQG